MAAATVRRHTAQSFWGLAISMSGLVCAPPMMAQAGTPVQEPLSIAARTSLDAYRDGRRAIELAFSRVPDERDGRIVVIAGTTDVTALTARDGTSLTIEPGLFPLPAGDSQLTILLRTAHRWSTLATFPIRILGGGGFLRSSISPTINVGSTGLVADGRTAGATSPAPARTQDVTVASTLRSAQERPGFVIESQTNMVGANREELALRFAQRGDRAPRVDLSDYLLSMRMPHAKLEVGHVALGANRHLVSGFASRGMAFTAGPAWAALTIGSVAGAPIVGWDNLAGVAQAQHRVNSASLGVELIRTRPGAMQLRFTALNGSLLPRPGFTQGAITDAEASRGAGIELSAATRGQRARLAAGYSRSAFDNPARDSQLTGGISIVRVERERRAARYVDGSLGVLQGVRLFGRSPLSATIGVRHERVDPLYRSVGASTQADRNQNTVDLTGTVGAIALQTSASRTRDNLANLASVLTSLTRGYTVNVAIPFATLLHVQQRATWYPQLSIGLTSAHQFALASRASNEFRPEDLANQQNVSLDISTQWQFAGWRIGLRDNRSNQDNRQEGRERSDLSGSVESATFSRSFGTRLDGSFDVSVEAQRNHELEQVNRVQRAGVSTNWRITAATALSSNLTAAVSRTPPATGNTTNLETRAELTHTIRLFGRGVNLRTGQLFLRFARTSVTAVPFGFVDIGQPPLGVATQIQWTLNTGLSLRAW